MDGTLTDQQVAIANKITANQYDNISTTNIVSGRTKCFYINNDVLSDMEMEKEKENRNIIEIILEWLFSTYYEKKYDKKKKELLDKYHDILVALEPDKEIEINQKSEVQIISILDDEHFTTAILDNKHKALVLIDPNGCILDTKKFKDCKDKKDIFCTLFGEKQADQLMKIGYSLCDGNFYVNNANNKKLMEKENKFFDNIAKTHEDKNGDQTKNGACGAVCCMMVKNYLRQRKKQKKQDIQTIIDNTNKRSISTTETIGYELKRIKNWDKVLSLNDTRNKSQQKGNRL